MNALFKRLSRLYRRYFKTVEFNADFNDQVIIVVYFNDTYVHSARLGGWNKRTCQLNEHGTLSLRVRRQIVINDSWQYSCVIFSSRSMHR